MAGMMIGVTVFAYIMSTVSSLLSSFNAQSTRSQERQQQVDSFCRTHKIPQALARKMSQYYDRVLGKQVHQEDFELVAGLSSSLRQQVCAMHVMSEDVSCVCMQERPVAAPGC